MFCSAVACHWRKANLELQRLAGWLTCKGPPLQEDYDLTYERLEFGIKNMLQRAVALSTAKNSENIPKVTRGHSTFSIFE